MHGIEVCIFHQVISIFQKCDKCALGRRTNGHIKTVTAMDKNGLHEIEINQKSELVQKEEERKRKISEAIKKKWLDPAYRKRATARMQQARNEANVKSTEDSFHPLYNACLK